MKNARRNAKCRNNCVAMAVAVLLVFSMVLAAGCSKEPAQPTDTTPQVTTQPTQATDPTTETTNPATEPTEPDAETEPTEPDAETEPTQPVTESTEPTEPEQSPAQASLDALRQEMAGTSQLFAVAYFGYHDSQDPAFPVDPYDIMLKNAPQLCADRSFMLDIPKDSVVGEYGHLFCIVPLDADASVAVSIGTWDDENGLYIYDDMIYSSDNGKPILLFCNNIIGETDTQLYISGASGEVFWSPDPADYRCVTPLLSDNGDSLLLDFSAYGELLSADYRLLEESEWVLPTEETLIGKTWGGSEFLDDDREFRYQISFDEEVCSIRWNDGTGEGDQELSYPGWELTYEEDFAVLTIDLFSLSEVRSYHILYHEDYDELYVATVIASDGVTPVEEPLYRYLSHFTAPDPVEMVGTWEQTWSEVEGYREEKEPGTCVMEISLDDNGLFWISYTNNAFPEENFSKKELIAFPGEMYMGCGNDQWTAVVNYTGDGGVEYSITLLYDGTILMQQYWEMDGAPYVSYGGYQRIY